MICLYFRALLTDRNLCDFSSLRRIATCEHWLTGIVDAAGINYASWTYNDAGLADSCELAGGVDRYDLDCQYRTGVRFA